MSDTLSPIAADAWLGLRPTWLADAEALTPALNVGEATPARLVDVAADPAGFQGWSVREVSDSNPDGLRRWNFVGGESVTLDFGRHQVGYLRFRIRSSQWFNDSPVRLRLVFGEVPAEVAEPFDPYCGTVSRAWLQDVQLDVDALPAEIRLPRRYAFRYLRVDVVAVSPEYAVSLYDFVCETVTSAGVDEESSSVLGSGVEGEIETVSLYTLRQCMQTVFEDGPKRDRRLWLGDLRLQALANSVSFERFDLVKRCLLLFAGCARSGDGVVPACVYEQPAPAGGNTFLLDYAALFGPTLVDYAESSGDVALAAALWPVALTQIDHCLRQVDSVSGLFQATPDEWLFFDWQSGLDKESAMHALIIYSARRTAALARMANRPGDAARLESAALKMTLAARRILRDPETGLYFSGVERQISWCTQAWMVLAGVPQCAEEASAIFDALDGAVGAVRPGGPYLWHYVVEALHACGRDHQAEMLLREYWGGMLKLGATTFWEVFDPADERRSPYGTCLVNSYSHAWSCTPVYFLRRARRRDALNKRHLEAV